MWNLFSVRNVIRNKSTPNLQNNIHGTVITLTVKSTKSTNNSSPSPHVSILNPSSCLPCPTPSPRLQLYTEILKQGQLTLDDKYIKNSLHLHIKPHKVDHNLSFEHNVSLSQSCRTRVLDLDSRPESGTSTPLKYKSKSSTSKSSLTSLTGTALPNGKYAFTSQCHTAVDIDS